MSEGCGDSRGPVQSPLMVKSALFATTSIANYKF